MIKEIIKDMENDECYYRGAYGTEYQDLSREEIGCILDYIYKLEYKIKSLQKELDNVKEFYEDEY